jgi:hypothetical protein
VASESEAHSDNSATVHVNVAYSAFCSNQLLVPEYFNVMFAAVVNKERVRSMKESYAQAERMYNRIYDNMKPQDAAVEGSNGVPQFSDEFPHFDCETHFFMSPDSPWYDVLA